MSERPKTTLWGLTVMVLGEVLKLLYLIGGANFMIFVVVYVWRVVPRDIFGFVNGISIAVAAAGMLRVGYELLAFTVDVWNLRAKLPERE